jgi:hypothetical protein
MSLHARHFTVKSRGRSARSPEVTPGGMCDPLYVVGRPLELVADGAVVVDLYTFSCDGGRGAWQGGH